MYSKFTFNFLADIPLLFLKFVVKPTDGPIVEDVLPADELGFVGKLVFVAKGVVVLDVVMVVIVDLELDTEVIDKVVAVEVFVTAVVVILGTLRGVVLVEVVQGVMFKVDVGETEEVVVEGTIGLLAGICVEHLR